MRISFAIVVAIALVLSTTSSTASAKTVGAPPVQFVRATLSTGTVSGVVGGSTLTLAKNGLSAGSYDDPFDIPDRGHVPWPSWVIDHVRAHAWPDLVRMTRLGVMTCQRGSDLIRMGPEHRDRNGLWCRPKKTRKRRRAFHHTT